MVKRSTSAPTRICPRCGSRDVVPIFWGYPANMERTLAAERRGEIVLGGCCVTGSDPALACKTCGERFGTPVGRRAKRPRRFTSP